MAGQLTSPAAKRQKMSNAEQLDDTEEDNKSSVAAMLWGNDTEQDQVDDENVTNNIEERLCYQEYRLAEIERKQEEYADTMDRALEEVREQQENHASAGRINLQEPSRAMARSLDEIRREHKKQFREMQGMLTVLEEQRKQQAQMNVTLKSMLAIMKKTCGQMMNGQTNVQPPPVLEAEPSVMTVSVSPSVVESNDEPPPIEDLTGPELTKIDGKICIPIGHVDLNPAWEYVPVEIQEEEYKKLRTRCRTVTSFIRGLASYFFAPDVLKRSNFCGTTVITKSGRIKKDQLDRRVVLTMLDQAELEYPGQVHGPHNYSKVRDVINDKCRHT